MAKIFFEISIYKWEKNLENPKSTNKINKSLQDLQEEYFSTQV